jgi:hypothetical protein
VTLKEYLEAQMRHFAKAAQEAREDAEKHSKFIGRYDAYVDILLTCPEDVLRRKIMNEVW